MGNSSWGKGYHTGYAEGSKAGGLIGSLGTLAFVTITGVAYWGYTKLKKLQDKKHEQDLDDENEDDEEGRN